MRCSANRNLPPEGKPVPIMAHFGGKLKEFIGYWMLDVVHAEELEEAEATDSVRWYTVTGNALCWVEYWFVIPSFATGGTP